MASRRGALLTRGVGRVGHRVLAQIVFRQAVDCEGVDMFEVRDTGAVIVLDYRGRMFGAYVLRRFHPLFQVGVREVR